MGHPQACFGISGLLLRLDRHVGLEEVVKKAPIGKLILETDAPHLIVPAYSGKFRWNTPNGIGAVAKRIGDLQGMPPQRVLMITTANARRLYPFEGKQ